MGSEMCIRDSIKYLHDEILLEMIEYPQGPSIDLLDPIVPDE